MQFRGPPLLLTLVAHCSGDHTEATGGTIGKHRASSSWSHAVFKTDTSFTFTVGDKSSHKHKGLDFSRPHLITL